MNCKTCGHLKKDHIYEEGACRPGFLCPCEKYMTKELSIPSKFTDEQMKLIINTVAKGATKDELELFLYRCRNMELDPLRPGQIYFIKYGNSPGTIVIGIDGFRARANKTGKLAGIKRGALYSSSGELIGAFAEVYRSDWKECAREEVALSEYSTGKAMWAKMPSTMIKKVAEAAALRMAFPDDLGGVYTREEMDQAENPLQMSMKAMQPAETDGRGIEQDLELAKHNKEISDARKPKCQCGGDFKYSTAKSVWFCGNFKAPGTHDRPVSGVEYKAWCTEISHYVADQSSRDSEAEKEEREAFIEK